MRRFLAPLLICLTFMLMTRMPQAQDAAPPPPTLSQADLEQLVAPIALFPDDLLMQVCTASIYPGEVLQADQWVKANPNMPPDQRQLALSQMPWDPSVTSLTQVPDTLSTMAQNIQWTQSLGLAFANQQSDLLAAIQSMRNRAVQAQSLPAPQPQPPPSMVSEYSGAVPIDPSPVYGGGGLMIAFSGGQWVIFLGNPQMVFVPIYNPMTVYGAWAPGYWLYPQMMAPPPNWVAGRPIFYSPAYYCGNCMFGGIDWHNRQVYLRRSYFDNPIYQGGVRANQGQINPTQVYNSRSASYQWKPNRDRFRQARLGQPTPTTGSQQPTQKAPPPQPSTNPVFAPAHNAQPSA
jgi:hypothetical protein